MNLGLRAGAEMHLEALDLPQASVQLTVGLGLNLEIRGNEDNSGNFGSDTGEFRLTTTALNIESLLATGIQLFFYF